MPSAGWYDDLDDPWDAHWVDEPPRGAAAPPRPRSRWRRSLIAAAIVLVGLKAVDVYRSALSPETLLAGLWIASLAPIALGVWGLVDVASRPDEAWRADGASRVRWVVLFAVGLLTPLGLVVPAVYYFRARPRLIAAGRSVGGGPPHAAPAASA
jgi:hypothetical protein